MIVAAVNSDALCAAHAPVGFWRSGANLQDMCNRYTAPDEASIERYWHVGRDNQWRGTGVFPRSSGPFIRRSRDDTVYSRELIVGQWGPIPWFAKEAKLAYSTNNARSEELAAKASFKAPWARGQRCSIPALSFDELC
jgi:putative SOS response-associated peptidase YedK